MGLDWKAQGVLADFREYQRASQNTDLVFHCTNGNVSAHQIIFAGISPFFTDLMQRFVIGQELFPVDLNISLPEIRREHVEMVVEMVYTGQVRIAKRDYQPFREICQLLKLSVPIGDYDKFFMNKGSNEDTSNSFDTMDTQEQVSIPLKSPTVPRVFVCDECDAIFPLKIALIKHKKSHHDESESEAPNPPQSPIVTETTVEPQLNTGPTRRRRPLNGSKNLVCLQNEERMVECPDCQSLFRPKQVQQHLAVHLKEELGVLVMRSKSGTGIFKCQENHCSYETTVPFYMSRHLGVTHDLIKKFANEAQMKFLQDAQDLISKPGNSSLKPCNLSPSNEDMNLNQRRTSQRVLETEDGPEKNNDIEPEIESAREESSESETQPSNEPDELNPGMVSQLNQPSSSALNAAILKSGQRANRVVECPDCQKLLHPSRVKHHLVSHLRKELNEFVKRRESKSQVIKCQFCSYETSCCRNMRLHVGVIHDKMSKFTNNAQKKFFQDAQNMMRKQENKMRLNILGTRSRIQENEDFPEVEETNVAIECNNGRKDATNNDLPPKKDGRALECPDCQSLIHPVRVRYHLTTHMQEKLNKYTTKSKSGRGLRKCRFFSHETTNLRDMHYHVGVKHQTIMKYVNEAQKKFIDDAQRMFVPHKWRRTLKRKQLKKPPPNVKCPDCLKNYRPQLAQRHLATHLKEQLNEHVTARGTIPPVFKCKLCSFESPEPCHVRRHLGLTHKMIWRYANPAQEKFLQDAKKMY